MPPVLFAALRFYLAGAVMLLYAVHSRSRWRPRGEDWRTVAVGALFFIAAHHAFLFVGEQYVTSAVAGVIISLDPVLAAGFAGLLLPDERLSRVGIVGLLFGLLGAGIVANPTPENLFRADVRGVVLVFLAAVAFALGAVLTRRFRTDLPAVSMQAWMMLVGAVVLHAISLALPSERLSNVEWTTDAILALGYLAFVAGGVGFLLYFSLLDEIGPVEINLVGYVAPVFAGFSGWLVLDESIQETTVLGFMVILVGFALLKRRALRDAL
ncbi:EamA family transporter [Halobacterium noricense]